VSTEGVALTVRATAEGACEFSGGEIAAGIVDVDIANESDDPLFVITLRLDEGRTFEELEQAPAELEPPDFATISARTFEPLAPGTETTEELAFVEAGEYAVVCATDKPPTEVPVLAPEPLTVTD
jgi:hypothetical protein